MKKFVMLLVALCLIIVMSGAAYAVTYFIVYIDWNGDAYDTSITSMQVTVGGNNYSLTYNGIANGISEWKGLLNQDPLPGDWLLVRPGGTLNWIEDGWFNWPENMGAINCGGNNQTTIHYDAP